MVVSAVLVGVDGILSGAIVLAGLEVLADGQADSVALVVGAMIHSGLEAWVGVSILSGAADGVASVDGEASVDGAVLASILSGAADLADGADGIHILLATGTLTDQFIMEVV